MDANALILFLLVVGAIFGFVGFAISQHNGGNGTTGFLLGAFLGPIGLIIAALLRPKQTTTGTSSPALSSGEFNGERSLGNDGYKLWLASRYDIKKNDVLDSLVCGERLFATVEAALSHADNLDQERLEEKAQADQDYRIQQEEAEERRRRSIPLFIAASILSLAIVILLVYFGDPSNDDSNSSPANSADQSLYNASIADSVASAEEALNETSNAVTNAAESATLNSGDIADTSAALGAEDTSDPSSAATTDSLSEDAGADAAGEHSPGDVRSLFTADDYPESARLAGKEGTVQAELTIDRSGKVTSCTVVQSSGTDVLDSRTCAILRQRAHFHPVGRQAAPSTFLTPPIEWRLQE